MTTHPLLASLRRHKLTAGLLMVQIAMTCAIVCNIAFLIVGRVDGMRHVTGVEENSVLVIESSRTTQGNPLAAQQVDLQALRAVPGVISVSALDTLPLAHTGMSSTARSAPASTPAAVEVEVNLLSGSPGEVATLGLKLIQGRDFASSEYAAMDASKGLGFTGLGNASTTILSQSLADKLWPGSPPLGRIVYVNDRPYRVIGIVEHLVGPWLGQAGHEEYSMLLPLLVDTTRTMYALRTKPDDRDHVQRAAVDRLNAIDDQRIIGKSRRYDEVRADYFRQDLTMLGLLIASASGLLFVTGLGVAGLASFWVQQRYRQIGIRRAVGATRRDILHYFQIENALIVALGLVLGMVLAVVLNGVLMIRYELPRLPLAYLPIVGIGLLLVGQVAVWLPARRAASIEPLSAIRPA